ncbi:MAG: hypothetical protein M5U28_30600 [Sandaracinaceae bacterium]|nr:hypothetical protein [Sandaracinaceae bacterium]
MLDTFVANCLEIDDEGPGFGDANMVVGDDIDGSLSYQLPVCSAGPFIDWADLPDIDANHRVFDLAQANGRDHTAFPGANECVDEANVLSKMDLTFGVVANNFQFVYLGLQRSAVNGDAAYYWLFTRIAPQFVEDTTECGDDARLMYDLSGPGGGGSGDVLVRGSFQGGGGAIFEVYQATAVNDSQGLISAVEALDYTSARWAAPMGLGPLTAAVNTTRTEAALGDDGIKALDRAGGLPPTGTFAEGAVPLSVFTGGSSCGASYFASVITRSSGAGGTSPDLKDLLGPFAVNFGSLTAQASMTGLCDSTADYAVTNVVGPDGSPVGSPTCSWTFDDGDTSPTCSGNEAFATTGAHSGDVVVTDPTSGCSITIEDVSATVLTPISVSLVRQTAVPMCPGMVSDAATYTAVASGGSGTLSYTWSGVTCTGTSCTINPADGDFCVGPTQFRVTVDDTSICPAVQSELETYQKVTTVTATDNPAL